jgi:hypothetical protein
MQKTTLPDNNIARTPLAELRQKWAECWGIQPHARIGRQMLEKSLEFKQRGGFSAEQQARVDHLIAAYRRNPKSFDQGTGGLKPGTKLVRTFRGEKYLVLVKADGFEYRQQVYGSLSEVAYAITGSRWNGWVFFGLKKSGGKA